MTTRRSSDGTRRGQHPKSKAALKNTAPVGNQRALQHGARAETDSSLVYLDATRQKLADWIAATAPVRESGGLPPADAPAVDSAARTWARLRQIDDYIAEHGPLDEDGNPRPALLALERTTKNLNDSLAQLGMTPKARAELGLNLAKAADLATAMSEPDPARRRTLLIEAGVEASDE